MSLQKKRIEIIDIIRGIAVFGILVVNMAFYNSSYQAISMQVELWPGFWDQLVKGLESVLFEGKFIAVFSFLFGFGMIMLKEAALKRDRPFAPLFARRLSALLLFGLIHGLLIWYGDILFHYALLGFFLLLFHQRKPKTLLIWAVVLLSLLPALLLLTGGGVASDQFQAIGKQAMNHDMAIYGHGSFSDISKQRFFDWLSALLSQVMFYPHLLGLFLLGSYFAKKKIFHDLTGNRPLLRRICGWTFILGFGATLIPLLLEKPVGAGTATLEGRLVVFRYVIAPPLIALFYITGLTLLFQRKGWKKVLHPFSYVGRMAFTNYIMQSIICTLVFYSYGLGLYGKVGHFAGLLLSLGVFSVQVIGSILWFRKFRIGPLEWVWRLFTYLQLTPIRKDRRSADYKIAG